MTASVFDIPGYTLVRELGAGGMATVFLAVQTSLDRRVAIKVMRRGLTDDNVEKRFLLEGRTMARLPHPNIVGVYDIVQNESINYIAMEYLDGGMLSDRLRAGLTLAEAISIVVQIGGALQFAHDNGIVHRDLKPANIMFRDAHTPVLTDFGIARQQDPASTRLTQTGMMIGTPTYMSPEQATGGDIDGRSDQYSLGVLFYEMLTGHAPFEGDTPIQVVLAHLNTPPPSLPAQFAIFQPIMDRLLAKDREVRYPDLRAFTRDLKTLLGASDALQQRLQIDSNQTASEQLRALGFSESQIHTGASRISGAAPAVSDKRTGSRTGSGPGIRMIPRRRARPVWLLPAGIALLFGAILGGWLFFGRGGDDLDPALRKLVDSQLVTVDQLIAENKLVAPPGNNAYELLQDVLQVAAGYSEAQQRLDRIVNALREQAETALAAKNFAAAETRIAEALAVAPQDAAVLALQKKIELARLAAERDALLADLLDRAASAREAGRLSGEGSDNALALLREALAVDPGSRAAKTALAELSGQLLRPATSALRAGRLDEAENQLAATEPFLAGEPAWHTVRNELQQARDQLARQQRIEQLLAEANKRLAAGRIAEPAGDNALETLARVREIDAANGEAAKLAAKAGEALVAQAQRSEKAGEVATAMTRYEQALQAVPGQPQWAAAKQALEQQLGARQQQLARALADARTALIQRRYYTPVGNSARDALDTVLELDPGNADARRLSAELPDLARGAAKELADEGRLEPALALLAEIAKRHRDDHETAALAAKLTVERDRLANQAQRKQKLAELQQLLAGRQLSPDIARQTAILIASLQKLDINDADALKIRETFLGGIGRAASQASSIEQIEAAGLVLAEVERQLGATSPDVSRLRRDFAQRSATLAAEASRRLAAVAGVLVLNAQPWANIESVVEQGSKQALALPKDVSTPLRLVAAPGTYRVTFRHPAVSRPVVRIVTLEPRGEASGNATFPSIEAGEFLRRAGYTP